MRGCLSLDYRISTSWTTKQKIKKALCEKDCKHAGEISLVFKHLWHEYKIETHHQDIENPEFNVYAHGAPVTRFASLFRHDDFSPLGIRMLLPPARSRLCV